MTLVLICFKAKTIVFAFPACLRRSAVFIQTSIYQKRNKNMSKHLFTSFRTWRICMAEGFKKLGWGLWRIISGIALGIASLLAYAASQVNAFCRRESIAAIIVATLIVILSTGWIFTYVDARVKATTAEHQRDSIAYKMSLYMQAYDSTDIVVVRGDTIKQ